MNLIYFTFVAALCIQGILCLDLTDITVPSFILIDGENDTEPIAMDCVYQLSDDPKALVVKWLKDDKPIYQWIYGQYPIVFKDFKDTVNASSTSSDENKLYSGIKVQRNMNAAGKYKCVVYTPDNTESMEKRLQVVDIENYAINVQLNVADNETHVECKVTGVYPEPILELFTDDNDTVTVLSVEMSETENGYFNSTLVALVNDDDDDLDEYKCIAKFPGLDFVLTTSALSNDGTTLFNCHLVLVLVFSLLIHSLPSLLSCN